MTNKIRNTYVGYDKKLHEADIDKIISEIETSTSKDTFANLSKLTLYFNDCHLSLFEYCKKNLEKIDSNDYTQNLKSILQREHKNKLDGYWINEENTVIIYLKQKSKKATEGYVIESKNNTPKGFCNIKINIDGKNNLIGDYINIDRGIRVFTKSYFKNEKVLLLGSHCRWRKVNNYYEGMLKDKIITDFRPAIKILDSNTIVFNIKDFSIVGSSVYDSVVRVNLKVIEKAKTLIIDARNNAGGG